MARGSFVLLDKKKGKAMRQQMMNLCTDSIQKIIKDGKLPIAKMIEKIFQATKSYNLI